MKIIMACENENHNESTACVANNKKIWKAKCNNEKRQGNGESVIVTINGQLESKQKISIYLKERQYNGVIGNNE